MTKEVGVYMHKQWATLGDISRRPARNKWLPQYLQGNRF
jgi:hypothetical protein